MSEPNWTLAEMTAQRDALLQQVMELRAAQRGMDDLRAATATRDAEFVALRRTLWERMEQCQQQAELIRQLESERAASAERVRVVVRTACLENLMFDESVEAGQIERIATRAAEQLAGAFARSEKLADAFVEAVDRMRSPPEPDYRAAITALLDSDMPAGELRKALAEIVGLK